MKHAPFLKPVSPSGIVIPAAITILSRASLNITSLYKYGFNAVKYAVSLVVRKPTTMSCILSISSLTDHGRSDFNLKAPIIIPDNPPPRRVRD